MDARLIVFREYNIICPHDGMVNELQNSKEVVEVEIMTPKKFGKKIIGFFFLPLTQITYLNWRLSYSNPYAA